MREGGNEMGKKKEELAEEIRKDLKTKKKKEILG